MTDYISRADAIEAVASADETNGTVKVFSGLEIIDMLKALPSADTVSREFYEDAVKANIRIVIENRELKEQIESADRPSGEWLKIDTYFEAFNETVTTYKCSACEYEPYFGGDISKLNYCPSCGARMYKGGAE